MASKSKKPSPIRINANQKATIYQAFNTADSIMYEALQRTQWSCELHGGFSNPVTQLLANRQVYLIEVSAKVYGKQVNLTLLNWCPSRDKKPRFSEFGGDDTIVIKRNADYWRRIYREGISDMPSRDIIAMISYLVTQVATGYPRSSETAIKCAYGNALLEALPDDAITDLRIDYQKAAKEQYTLPIKGLEQVKSTLQAGMAKWAYLMGLTPKNDTRSESTPSGGSLYEV